MPAFSWVLLRCDHRQDVLIETGFADEEIEEFRSFVPPMTEEFGILLIFDEVKTGFRLAKGGASAYFVARLRTWRF